MSLKKSIDSGKEHRKHYKDYLYRGGWFKSCVNHNPKRVQCPWCRDNRLHGNRVRTLAARSRMGDYETETDYGQRKI